MSSNENEEFTEEEFGEEINELKAKKKVSLLLTEIQLAECRNIVKQIMDFGVSQNQIIQIISLLGLELENFQMSKEIRDLMQKYIILP